MAEKPTISLTHIPLPPEGQLQALAQTYDLRLIALFGSSVSGHTRPDSDVDLGILVRGHLSAAQRRKLWSALSRLFPADVDLSVLNHVEPLLAYRVAREGIALFEAETGEWEAWKSYAVRRFWDTHQFRQALKEYLDHRAEEMRHAVAE